MKIFVAASYSSQVDYETGEVNAEYRDWLESELVSIEGLGHEVFCALRADNYKINDTSPAEAFKLDERHITESDILLAYVSKQISAGVQTEIGYALALGKKIIIARDANDELGYFNMAIVQAGRATEIIYPVADNLGKFV